MAGRLRGSIAVPVAIVALGVATASVAQGVPGELPLPLRYLDTASGHPTIHAYHSSGGHPIALLDSVDAPQNASRAPTRIGDPLRVLFIGNSLTYYNGMARTFAALAAAGLRRCVVVGVAAYPGASMDLLWRWTDVQQVIGRFPWDYVITQPRPNGLDDSVSLMADERQFHAAIVARNAHTVVWSQYRIGDTRPEDQAILNAGIAAAARSVDGVVAPVPAAWEAVREASDTSLWRRLFVSDTDGHPSPLGSYLIALVVYRTVTGQSPIGLPRAAGGETFSEQEVEALQRAAASAH